MMVLALNFQWSLSWECISVDNDPKYTETTIICDVLEWEVPERLHGSVGAVTIGVPCTAYSTANKRNLKRLRKLLVYCGGAPSKLLI